jgi:hypothetical protein
MKMMKDYINGMIRRTERLEDLKSQLKMWKELKDEVDMDLVYKKFKEFEGDEENEVWLVLEEELDDDEVEEIGRMYKDYIFNFKIN